MQPRPLPVPALPSRAAQLWSADPGASISSVARQLDIYGAMQATMTQLASGVFLTAYALALGADPLAIAVLAAVPLAAKVSQVFTSAHIERAGHWPQTALVCAAIARLLLLAAAALPFLLEGPMAARALVAIIALSSLVASFFDLALLTWMAELVPPGIRGRFLGTRNRISGLAGQVAALAAAAVIQGMFGETGRSPFVFAVLFAVAGSLGLAALPVLARVPPPRRTRSRVEMLPLRNMLVAPLRDRNVRIFMLFAVLWHAAIGISSPFLLVFMLEELGLSLLSVTALVSLNLFVAAGTMGYWGRLGDHFGAKTVLRAGTYLIMLPTVLWLIVAPGRTWPIVIFQFVAGLGWGAYNSNVNNLMLKLAPAGRGPSVRRVARRGDRNGRSDRTTRRRRHPRCCSRMDRVDAAPLLHRGGHRVRAACRRDLRAGPRARTRRGRCRPHGAHGGPVPRHERGRGVLAAVHAHLHPRGAGGRLHRARAGDREARGARHDRPASLPVESALTLAEGAR